MKTILQLKKLFFIPLLFLVGNVCLGQTLINETFIGATFPPNGWSLQSTATGNNTWYNMPGSPVGALLFESQSTPQDEWLKSPALDLSSFSSLYLTFNLRIQKNSMITNNTSDFFVKISTDGGTNWVNLWNDTNFEYNSNSNIINLNLANYIGAGFTNVKIAFHYTSLGTPSDGSIVQLYSVKASNDCPTVGVVTNNLTQNAISWLAVPGFTGTYEIEYGPLGFTQGTGTLVTGLSGSSYTLPTSLCTYSYRIRTNCGTSQSPWSGIMNFNNQAFNIVDSITSNSNTITWSGNAPSYQIEYGPTGFLQGTGVLVSNVTGNTYTINNLFSCTTYQYYVRAECGSNNLGIVLGPRTFTTQTTLSAPLSVPFTESYNSGICQIGYTSGWGTNSSGSTANNTLQVLSSNTNGSSLYSRGIQLTAGVPVDISCILKKHNTTTTANCNIKIGSEQYNSASYTTIGFLNNTINTSFVNFNSTYTPTTTGVHYIWIELLNGGTNGSGYAFDDLKVTDCVMALGTVSETGNTATINWTGSAATYEIEYGSFNFSPGTGTMVTGLTGNSYTITGLSTCQNYTIRYRSNCGTEQGNWKIYNLNTTAALQPYTIPFTELFDNSICQIGYTPTGGFSYSGSAYQNQLSVISNGFGAAVYSRPFYLTAGVPVEISYKNRRNSNLNTSGRVSIGTNTANESSFALLSIITNNSLLTTFTQRTITYTPTTTGLHYIQFKVDSTIESGAGIIFDDFKISDCAAAINSTTTTGTSATINWAGNATSTFDIEYGLAGFTLGTGTQINGLSGTSHTITNLQPCTTYWVFIRSNCGGNLSSYRGREISTLNSDYSATTIPYSTDFESTICELKWKPLSGSVSTHINVYTTKNLILLANSQVLSRGLNLIAGQQYIISYKYSNTAQQTQANFNLSIGTSENIANHTILKSYNPSNGNGIAYNLTQLVETLSFTPTVSGVYYVGFNVLSESCLLNFDDFSVTEVLSTSNFEANNVKVYPNPTNDVLNIKSIENNLTNLVLIDLQGRKISEHKTNGSTYQLDLQNLPPAVYLLQIETDKGKQTIKVVKK